MHHCVHRGQPQLLRQLRHGPALPLRVVAVGAGDHHMGRAAPVLHLRRRLVLQPLVGGLDPGHQGGHAAVVGPLGQQGGHGGGGGSVGVLVTGDGHPLLPGRLDLVQ